MHTTTATISTTRPYWPHRAQSASVHAAVAQSVTIRPEQFRLATKDAGEIVVGPSRIVIAIARELEHLHP